jgi:predicted nucleotidyltransferase component of viral defense system
LRLLPPETDKIWRFLKEQPALDGFVLVGGSALAMTIGHRLSEDLDFIYPETRLPRQRLDVLRRAADEFGFDFQRRDDEAAVREFLHDGMDLHNYQQDFFVNNAVKVSFFAPEEPVRKILSSRSPDSRVRVALLSEIFKTKCLVSATRSKSRDWLDLYLLMREHGFSIQDYQSAFREAGVPAQCDIGLARLCSGVPQRDDEGFAHLLQNPPSLDDMKSFFVEQRNRLEIESASEAIKNK